MDPVTRTTYRVHLVDNVSFVLIDPNATLMARLEEQLSNRFGARYVGVELRRHHVIGQSWRLSWPVRKEEL